MEKYKRKLQPPATIGIIGGGQLGRMLTMEAKRMGYHVTVLDPTPGAPAGQVADSQIVASFKDAGAIRRLAELTDVLTYEFEHIDSNILGNLEAEGYSIYPSSNTLKIIQDKYTQKMFLKSKGLPVPEFRKVASKEDIAKAFSELGAPLILKTCTGGYDGKGNLVLKHRSDMNAIPESFLQGELMVEEYICFDKELSIIAARNMCGENDFFPVAENFHEDNILRLTKVPAEISTITGEKVKSIANGVMEAFSDVGVFCIELFHDQNGNVYINEIAPRPHNSGHYTIEACITSQFEQLARIITGMPLGSTRLISPCAMVNILGNEEVEGRYTFEGLESILEKEGVYFHLYGKKTAGNMRKIGHITVLGDNAGIAAENATAVLDMLKLKRLEDGDMQNDNPSEAKKVGIIMGSDSDFSVMNECAKILDEFGVGYEISVVSAHRTPDRMYQYAVEAEERGIEVIVAGAGGAAHLPGMVAALTHLPVIGVPVKSRSLDGLDSLLSIVQMPPGVPVAAVAINGAANAGLLAVQMLSIKYKELGAKLKTYKDNMKLEVAKKDQRIKEEVSK